MELKREEKNTSGPNRTILSIDQKIEKLDNLINEILIDSSENDDMQDSLIERSELFMRDLDQLFDSISAPLNEEQIDQLTLICRKANENPSFQLLLFHLKIHSSHPRIVFKRPATFLGDQYCLETEVDAIEEQKIENGKKSEAKKEIKEKPQERKLQVPQKSIEIDKNIKLMSDVQSLIKESLFHYKEEHKIDKPFKILQKINKMKEQYELDPKLGKFFHQIFQENADHFFEIKKEFDYMEILLKEIEAKDWIHEKTKGKISVYYKIPQGTTTCSLKFEAELDIPVRNMASIIYECDLMHIWVPFCKISKTVKKIHKASKAFYNEMDLPFISNREVYCVGYGINRLEENGTILIVAKTIDQDQDFQKKHEINVPQKTKLVRMDINFFITEVRPITENRIKVKMISNLNPKLKVIPISLINFMTRKFGIKLFEILVGKASKNFEKSPWFKMSQEEESQDFYKWLDHSIVPFVKKQ